MRSERASCDTVVYACLHMCMAYLIVGSVIDHRVALIQKYIYGIYIYIWKYLVYCFLIYLAILDIQLRGPDLPFYTYNCWVGLK